MVLSVIAKMIAQIFRRGRGIFKILFIIDDFFRYFTMTILIPIFFSWLGFGQFLMSLGAILGLVIDIHDYMSEAKIVKG